MRNIRTIGALLLVALLGACAWTPAELELKPRVVVAPSDIGRGVRLAFKFIDERDDVTIGHRSVATVGAKITAGQLPALVEAKLREGLQQKQFILVSDRDPKDAEVTFRLRSFKFEIEQGFWTGGRNASAALAVDARRRDRPYTNVYRYNSEERILAVPAETEINQQMNEALSQILTKALSDNALDTMLAGQ